jgi:CRISPR/Cas system CSM-associated protein Csm2 small subunit
MTNQQRYRSITQSSSNDIEPAGNPFDSAGMCQQEKRNRMLENEYDDRLKSMQQFICELLIKNQQLRWLLNSSTNRQDQEPAGDQSEDVARI